MIVTDPGLCGHCHHCRLVETARSRFYLCGLAASDPRFRKYPPLPVRACPGFEDGDPRPVAPPGPTGPLR